jgi:hypothetical protein
VKQVVNVSWWPHSNLKFEEAVVSESTAPLRLAPFLGCMVWGAYETDWRRGQQLHLYNLSFSFYNHCDTAFKGIVSRGLLMATGMMENTTDTPDSGFNVTELTLELEDVHTLQLLHYTPRSTTLSTVLRTWFQVPP